MNKIVKLYNHDTLITVLIVDDKKYIVKLRFSSENGLS